MRLTGVLLSALALGAYLLTLAGGVYTLLLVGATVENPSGSTAIGAVVAAVVTLFCFLVGKALSQRGSGLTGYDGVSLGKAQ